MILACGPAGRRQVGSLPLHTQRMPSSTLRYKRLNDRLSAAVYWRRRFAALLAGIAVLGIVGWAFSGALGGGGTGSKTADVGRVRHSGGAATGSAAGTSAAGSQPRTAPATAQSPGAAAAQTPAPGRSASPSPGPGIAVTSAPPCVPGDVVISLSVTQASYGQGQPPEFDVDVVSTAAGTCSFNVGPRYLAVVVTAGKQRVWGSADCAAAPASLVTNLARGVPMVLPVLWDRQTSAPGCPATTAGPAAGGSYTATAADGGLTSNSVTFRLG